jgi:hypothetical protein
MQSSLIPLRRKISAREASETCDLETWHNSDHAKKLRADERHYQMQEQLCNRQANFLAWNVGGNARALRRSFVNLFTTSTRGLQVLRTGKDQRNRNRQRNFREKMIKAYHSQHPDKAKRNQLWCPILEEWVSDAVAAHIFEYRYGKDSMNAIFGEGSGDEMFSPKNGLIISQTIEDEMQKGTFVIVPNFADGQTTAEEISHWQQSDPQDYKIRLLVDLDSEKANEVIMAGYDTCWKDLHGRQVLFQSDERPRAKYLYFHYCSQILIRAFEEKPRGGTMRREIGKHFWGTPGKYMRENMLRAFVEELGQGWEILLQGATEEGKGEESNLTGVYIASDAYQRKKNQQDAIDEDDGEMSN